MISIGAANISIFSFYASIFAAAGIGMAIGATLERLRNMSGGDDDEGGDADCESPS